MPVVAGLALVDAEGIVPASGRLQHFPHHGHRKTLGSLPALTATTFLISVDVVRNTRTMAQTQAFLKK